MKNLFFIFLLSTIISLSINAQNSNHIRTYYGFTDSELIREELVGAASYSNKDSYEYGFVFNRKINKNLSVETGANLFKTDVVISPAFIGVPVEDTTEKLELITIPVYLNYALGKYFFVNGGLLADFQQKGKSFDSQSGIGAGLGVGAKVNFDSVFIFINSNAKVHAIAPFQKQRYQQRLVQSSLQIGAGYEF